MDAVMNQEGLSILVTILCLIVVYKLSDFLLNKCGKVLGSILSFLAYVLLGILFVIGFRYSAYAIPIICIIGVVVIVSMLQSDQDDRYE